MSKSKRQRVIEESREDLLGILERLGDVAEAGETEPYLSDAGGFIAQASVCLAKQLQVKFNVQPPAGKPGRLEDK